MSGLGWMVAVLVILWLVAVVWELCSGADWRPSAEDLEDDGIDRYDPNEED